MSRVLAAVMCAALSGCSAMTQRAVPVNVAIPIKCKAKLPERPVMPTEVLSAKAGMYQIVRAALAELAYREAYEIQLVTELKSCL
jgi:type IV pilus biogenesis protein CpaD/CtpE